MLQTIWNTWLQLAPWMLLGAFAAGLMHVLIPAGWMKRHLNGRLGILKAVAVGVPLPLCSCGVIPVGLSIRKHGGSKGAAVGFLISTPQTGVDSILVSASMLGWPFAVLKVVVAVVTGVFGGILSNLLDVSKEEGRNAETSEVTKTRSRGVVSRLFDHSLEVIESIWGWLVIGVLVSAGISWMFPAGSLQGTDLDGPWVLLLAIVLSVPLYVCTTASVPIAASLIVSGLPIGAALVFLMAGPATNLATLGSIYRSLGLRSTGVYLGTIVVGSFLAGLGFNQWVTVDSSALLVHEHGDAAWQVICGVVLALLILMFAIRDSKRFLRRSAPISQSAVSVTVTGMTCNGCASRLEKTLNAHPNVEVATVSFDESSAVVSGTISERGLAAAVRDAGFTAQELQP